MLWLNGEFLETASLNAASAGNLLGAGVFTTLGVREGAPLFLENHLRRLRRDATICGLEISFSNRELGAATRELIARNGVQNGAARITVSRRGDGFWCEDAGINALILAKSRAPLPVFGLKALLFWGVAPDLAGVKTTSYWPYSRAFDAAKEHGYDEAIFLGHDGNLAECARSTLFFVRENTLCTPALAGGALRGVGREIALEWARKNGILAREGQFSIQDLLDAQATFALTGASGPRELIELRETSGSKAPLAGAGEIFGSLRALWSESLS